MSEAIEHDPRDLAIEAEDGRALRNAVEDLDDDLSIPVRLRFDEGLTFSRIAQALRISESTAHERVERAMARLRARLAAAGVTLGTSEAAVRAEWASDPTHIQSAPAGLKSLLLRKEATAAAAGSPSLALVIGGMVIAAGGLVFAALPLQREVPVEPGAHTAQSPVGTPRAGVAVRGGSDDERSDAVGVTGVSDEAKGQDFVLTGRVTDERGRPVSGAVVRLYDRARTGKLMGYSVVCEAGEDGRYRLTVPMAPGPAHPFQGDDPVRLTLEAGHLGFFLGPARSVEVSAGGRTELDLELERSDGGRPGDYVLDLLVRDARGEPVEGALVELTHVAPADAASLVPGTSVLEGHVGQRWIHSKESRGRTDARGLVPLNGARLGPKSVWIEAPGDFAPMRTSFVIHAEGRSARDVTLDDGHVLRGRFVWAPTDELAPDEARALSVAAVLEPNRWRTVRVAADGSFEVRGLEAGSNELRIQRPWDWPKGSGPPPSPARIERATGDGVRELPLKRVTDARDIGLHDGELHGSAYDARTGAIVPLTEEAVIAWPVVVPPGGDLAHDVLANIVHVPPFQRELSQPERARERFHRVGLVPGAYMLQIHAPDGRIGWTGPVALESNEVRADLRVELAPPAEIAVSVLDGAGEPLDGAVVVFTGVGPVSDSEIEKIDRRLDESNGRERVFQNGARRAGADGRTTLRLPAGLRGRIVALHAHYAPARGEILETTSGDTRTIELRVTERR